MKGEEEGGGGGEGFFGWEIGWELGGGGGGAKCVVEISIKGLIGIKIAFLDSRLNDIFAT